MKHTALFNTMLLAVACAAPLCLPAGAAAGEKPAQKNQQAKTVAYDVHDGYFVSNKFEPKEASSFVAVDSQKAFDSVFGAGFVMRDKSHRLPKDAFAKNNVVAVIQRGKALVTYKVESVTQKDNLLTVRYTTKSEAPGSAEYASPLILSVAKGTYKEVQFVENGKDTKKIPVPSLVVGPAGAAAPQG